jgi:hypothetical protein
LPLYVRIHLQPPVPLAARGYGTGMTRMSPLLRLPDEVADRALPALAPAVSAVVHTTSRLRGERVIHGSGRTVSGRLRIEPGATTGAALFDHPGSHDVVLRFSRSAGLPAPLPDVHGLAIRVLDAYGNDKHQDLLLDSAAAAPVLRRWPLPAFRARTYSSLLSYDVAGAKHLLGARRRGDDLELLVASPHGTWRVVGMISVGDEVAEGRRIRFNIANTGGGLKPLGLVQRLRMRSYDAARVGPDA